MGNLQDAERIIATLGLRPLPGEGGLYRSTWATPAGSAIYYMLVGSAFSHLHRLDTDEIYHFYAGDPVELLVLSPGGAGKTALLGGDVLAGQAPQCVVPAGAWQGSRLAPGGAWALMGTTMAPAYTQAGYTQGDRAALAAKWPAWGALITALTGPQPGPRAHGAGELASPNIYP